MMHKTCLAVAVPAPGVILWNSRPVHAQTGCCPSWSATAVYTGDQKASYNDENYTTTYWGESQNPSSKGGTAETIEPSISAALLLYPSRFHDTSLPVVSPCGHPTETTKIAQRKMTHRTRAMKSLRRDMRSQRSLNHSELLFKGHAA